LIDAVQLDRFVTELRERQRAGRPTSLARLLIERGIEGGRVRAAAVAGSGSAVKCDACGVAHDVKAAFGREFGCPRCGALVVSLGEVPVPVTPGAASLAPSEPTLRFNQVLQIPEGGTDDARTVRFDGVLPLPPPAQVGPIEPFPAPPDAATVDSRAITQSDPDRQSFRAPAPGESPKAPSPAGLSPVVRGALVGLVLACVVIFIVLAGGAVLYFTGLVGGRYGVKKEGQEQRPR
jgi:hypothetical protein